MRPHLMRRETGTQLLQIAAHHPQVMAMKAASPHHSVRQRGPCHNALSAPGTQALLQRSLSTCPTFLGALDPQIGMRAIPPRLFLQNIYGAPTS